MLTTHQVHAVNDVDVCIWGEATDRQLHQAKDARVGGDEEAGGGHRR
jgi:hypothetical protein